MEGPAGTTALSSKGEGLRSPWFHQVPNVGVMGKAIDLCSLNVLCCSGIWGEKVVSPFPVVRQKTWHTTVTYSR